MIRRPEQRDRIMRFLYVILAGVGAASFFIGLAPFWVRVLIAAGVWVVGSRAFPTSGND